jgi:hypothetical protein
MLVHQLPGVVTFAYDLLFRRVIAPWKDLSEDYIIFDKMKFCNIPQKTSFRASKRLQNFRTRKTAKNSKLPKMSECCFEPVGKGGWPPISIWINPPSLEAMVSIALSSRGRGQSVCWICIWVNRLYCWRHRAAWVVEVCHEPVEVEVVQQVQLHERKVCRRNFFALLQPCRHASVG